MEPQSVAERFHQQAPRNPLLEEWLRRGAAGRMTEAGRGVQERHSVRGGFAPATGGRGSSGEMIREGRGPHLGQSLGRGARSGVPFAGVGSGAGSGMHAGLNGGAGAGGCMSFRSGGGIESGVGSGSSEGAATSRGGNPGRATGSARAYGPMMGMRGKDNEKKRAKSVTTQVERDPNKRDLLGGAARCRTRCHRGLGAGSGPRKIA